MNIEDFNNAFKFDVYLFKNGTFNREIPMRPCIANDWAALGSTYEEDFKTYFLNLMMCPNTD